MSFQRPSARSMGFEVLRELLLRPRHERRPLGRHRGAHRSRRVVLQAVVRLHQRGQAAEVVVVGVGVEHALDLVHADAQRRQAVLDVGPGVDEVDPALEDHDGGHCRAVDVPSVAVARVDDAEIVAPRLGSRPADRGEGYDSPRLRLRSTMAVSPLWLNSKTLCALRRMPAPPRISTGSLPTASVSRNSSLGLISPKAKRSFMRISRRARCAFMPACLSSSLGHQGRNCPGGCSAVAPAPASPSR